MKSLVESINMSESYERYFAIPPYEYEVIMKALHAYKDNVDRKKNAGNGEPDDKQLNGVIKFMTEKYKYK
jgi:hypothetical protein